MYFVYILKSTKTGDYYKGLASDLNQRLKEHTNGKVQFTKGKLPVVLIHVEIVNSLKEAEY